MPSVSNHIAFTLQPRAKTNSGHFATLIIVFFFWGFVAASNDILIPVFKDRLHLEQWQSQMVSFAYYVAYTIGAVVYYIISKLIKRDLIFKLGYKNSISLGLVISAFGTFLFYPAAQMESFGLMITGLFIVGLGFSLQQMAANPLAILLGDPKTGARRLNFGGGINNFGTTIGPLIMSFAIFGRLSDTSTATASINAVKTPYLLLGAAFLIVALIFRYSSLPGKEYSGNIPDILPVEPGSAAVDGAEKKNALHFSQLAFGMIAIFVYVGVEVSTASNLPEFMRQKAGIPTHRIAPYISLYWASLMIGRWTAAMSVFEVKKWVRRIIRLITPYITFFVFIAVNLIMNHDVTPFYIYPAIIVVMIIGDALSRDNPVRQLMIFSLLAIIALLTGIIVGGKVAVFAFISVGLFCSTLWPCIFTVAIAGLGKHTNEGSSFLIMMCMGGGIISLVQGFVAKDSLLGIQQSYWVGVCCFAYLAFYAIRVKGILKRQGIDYDRPEKPQLSFKNSKS